MFLMAKWREARNRLAEYIGTDRETQGKVEKMDQHHRKIGHDLRNLQSKLEPLQRMIDRDEDGR